MTHSDDGAAPVRTPSVEAFRRAAANPSAPARLLRAADAVLDGKFTWEEAVNGQSDHPLAQALFTPKAKRTLWPLLTEPEPEPERRPRAKRPDAGDPDEDEDFSLRSYRDTSW